MNVEQSFYNYIEFEKRYSQHTLVSYKNDIRQLSKFIEDTFDLTDILDVKHLHVRSWIVHLMKQEYSSSAVNRKISSLKSFFKYAKRKGNIDRNPMQKIISPKKGKRLPQYVESGTLRSIVSVSQEDRPFALIRDELIVEILYSTGMRRAELISLKDNDIDRYNLQLKVMGKGSKERIIPFPESLMFSIKKYSKLKTENFEELDHNFLLITDKGKQLYPKFVYNAVKAYLNQITTIDKKSPHVLRHSYATHLVNNGAKLNAVKALLGHASLAATQIYTHNTIEKLKKAYATAHPKA